MNNRTNQYDYYFRTYGGDTFGNVVDWLWLKAQGIAESNLNPDALSPVGAIGVMQLMPGTATEMAKKLDIDLIANFPLIPHINIRMGITYDRQCWNIWKEESGIERIRFMLASYNAGPGNIIKAQKKAKARSLPTDRWQSIVQTLPDVTGDHAKETINYVARIERYYDELSKNKGKA